MMQLLAAARDYASVVRRSAGRLITGRSGPADAAPWVAADPLRLLWYVHTYHDRLKLAPALAALRRLYPESTVLVVSDGDSDPLLAPICARYRGEFRLGARLFGVEHGGEIVQRMLEAFLAHDADVLIKIDPDTVVRRQLTLAPAAGSRAIAGTIETSHTTGRDFIQGGCIVIPRRSASEIVASRLLQSDRLKPPQLEWVVGEMSKARAASGLTSIDQTLGWACRQVGIACVNHPEVFSRYRPSLVDLITSQRLPIYHPRFELRHLADANFYFSGIRDAITSWLARAPRR
jgi:hypothetical protein